MPNATRSCVGCASTREPAGGDPHSRRRARQPDRRRAGGTPRSQLRDELRRGGTIIASGIFVDREGDVVGIRGGRAGGGRPAGGGRLGRARGGPARLTARAGDRRNRATARSSAGLALQSAAMPAYFPILLGAHIILAVSLILPSILLPFTLRTRRATVNRGVPRRPRPALGADARDHRRSGSVRR